MSGAAGCVSGAFGLAKGCSVVCGCVIWGCVGSELEPLSSPPRPIGCVVGAFGCVCGTDCGAFGCASGACVEGELMPLSLPPGGSSVRCWKSSVTFGRVLTGFGVAGDAVGRAAGNVAWLGIVLPVIVVPCTPPLPMVLAPRVAVPLIPPPPRADATVGDKASAIASAPAPARSLCCIDM